jgi:hypothetical protein
LNIKESNIILLKTQRKKKGENMEHQKLKMQAQAIRREFIRTQAEAIGNETTRSVAEGLGFLGMPLTHLFAPIKNLFDSKPDTKWQKKVRPS